MTVQQQQKPTQHEEGAYPQRAKSDDQYDPWPKRRIL